MSDNDDEVDDNEVDDDENLRPDDIERTRQMLADHWAIAYVMTRRDVDDDATISSDDVGIRRAYAALLRESASSLLSSLRAEQLERVELEMWRITYEEFVVFVRAALELRR